MKSKAKNRFDVEKLFLRLGTENLSDVLARAEAGDTEAGREAISTLAWLVSTDNKHPRTNQSLPIPEFAREYLARCLHRIDSGADANVALNMKRTGRPKTWSHYELLAVSILIQLMEFEPRLDVPAASEKAAAAILKNATRAGPLWERFRRKKLEGETLMSWYYEPAVKREVARLLKADGKDGTVWAGTQTPRPAPTDHG